MYKWGFEFIKKVNHVFKANRKILQNQVPIRNRCRPSFRNISLYEKEHLFLRFFISKNGYIFSDFSKLSFNMTLLNYYNIKMKILFFSIVINF